MTSAADDPSRAPGSSRTESSRQRPRQVALAILTAVVACGVLLSPLSDGNTAGRVGVLLIPHKDNFRPSWFHVRDYGLLVANPFGQNVFTKGEKSRIEVKPGEKLDLRFGVWIYSVNTGKKPDFAGVASEYHRLEQLPSP